MSRAQLSDSELLAISGTVDLWIASPKDQRPMRTLKEAVCAEASEQGRARLYRPPGTGRAPIWIEADQIARLHALFEDDARQCA